jgi:peptidoglycan hydrolase-like protein with peptidoglycan-binding domain
MPSAKEASVASSLEIEPMEAKVEKQTGIRFIFTRQLRTGSVGEDVRELQKLLIRLGYLDVKESGLYGSKTSAAVKKMQKSYNLPTVGVIDKKTLNLLNKLSK